VRGPEAVGPDGLLSSSYGERKRAVEERCKVATQGQCVNRRCRSRPAAACPLLEESRAHHVADDEGRAHLQPEAATLGGRFAH
jgi:hypothetical protein